MLIANEDRSVRAGERQGLGSVRRLGSHTRVAGNAEPVEEGARTQEAVTLDACIIARVGHVVENGVEGSEAVGVHHQAL